eukprot:NODE_190_length_15503_cov_0.365814.p9 type:complete len:149 gc:universal NODE_190_length_15503_cov_0.365814:14666-14220(-)
MKSDGFYLVNDKTVSKVEFQWSFKLVDQVFDNIECLLLYKNSTMERLFVKTQDHCISCKCPLTYQTLFVIIPPLKYNKTYLECSLKSLFLLYLNGKYYFIIAIEIRVFLIKLLNPIVATHACPTYQIKRFILVQAQEKSMSLMKLMES